MTFYSNAIHYYHVELKVAWLIGALDVVQRVIYHPQNGVSKREIWRGMVAFGERLSTVDYYSRVATGRSHSRSRVMVNMRDYSR